MEDRADACVSRAFAGAGSGGGGVFIRGWAAISSSQAEAGSRAGSASGKAAPQVSA